MDDPTNCWGAEGSHDGRGVRRRLGTWAAVAALVVTPFAVTACGESSSDSATSTAATADAAASSGQVAEAEKLVAEQTAPVKWTSPGPKWDAAAIRGKNVFWISRLLPIPYEQNILAGGKEAAKKLGFNITAFDSKNDPNVGSQQIEQAINRKADLIFMSGFCPDELPQALDKAAQANIPVVMRACRDRGPIPAGTSKSVKSMSGVCYACAGKNMADYFVADSKGKGNALVVWSSEIREAGPAQLNALKDEVKRLCPDCKLDVRDTRLDEWGTKLPGLVQSALRSNPDIKYVLPLYDGSVSFVAPAIQAAGKSGDVKVVSFNATPAVLEMVKKNPDMVIADVGGPNKWEGWSQVDEFGRILSGGQATSDIKLPMRTFDAANLKDIDVKGNEANESDWYGVPDWRQQFLNQWGIS
jgi:ribose transport system substrate-binding protein